MIMHRRAPLCKYPNFKNKKAILFYNIHSWLISSPYVSSQCSGVFTWSCWCELTTAPGAQLGRWRASPCFTEKETKAQWLGAWHTVSWSGVMEPGSEIQSGVVPCSARAFKANDRKEATVGVICAIRHWPRQDGWQGGPRGLELRNTGQPPLGFEKEQAPAPAVGPNSPPGGRCPTWGQIPVLPPTLGFLGQHT